MLLQDQVKSWHILIVDDHPDSLDVVSFTIEAYGAHVLTANNGIEALAVLQSADVTFVLLDLSMPEMDGWDLIKHIRSDERTADLPVIALTAHAMAGDREKVMSAGFDGYLTKPLSPLSLLEDLMAAFKEKEGLVERVANRARLGSGKLIRENGRVK